MTATNMLDAHVDHIFKGLVEVVADLLDLIFLSQQVLLDLIDTIELFITASLTSPKSQLSATGAKQDSIKLAIF